MRSFLRQRNGERFVPENVSCFTVLNGDMKGNTVLSVSHTLAPGKRIQGQLGERKSTVR